eukprot:4431251-Amphidinium_carterae.1
MAATNTRRPRPPTPHIKNALLSIRDPNYDLVNTRTPAQGLHSNLDSRCNRQTAAKHVRARRGGMDGRDGPEQSREPTIFDTESSKHAAPN